MPLTISLSSETEQRLGARAAQLGLTPEEFVRRLVERECENGVGPADKPTPTFEEMTGPFARAVEAAGMSEQQLGEFFAEAVRGVRAEKRAGKGQSR